MTARQCRTDVDVLIVGAGPTGLTAAIDAVRHGLSVRIIARGPHRTPHSKALVMHSRTMEVFDDLGCVERLLGAGREFRALNIVDHWSAIARVEFSRLDWGGAPYPMWLTIPQSETERCLEEHLASEGVIVDRETTLRALQQDASGVDAELAHADGSVSRCRAAWVVGSDGARSDVRRLLDVGLVGDASGETFMLADVSIESELVDAEGYNVLSPDGVLLIVPMPEPGRVRLIAHLPGVAADPPPTIDLPMLQRLVDRRARRNIRLGDLGWTSVFSPKHLVATTHHVGRVFLAGDAGHIHSPVGGQGLNTGIQDAYNLIWKIAAVHRGAAAPSLLDTYGIERHTVASAMFEGVRKATRLLTVRSGLVLRVRNLLARLALRIPAVRNRLGPHIGMLHLRYPPSAATAAERSGLGGAPHPGERARMLADAPSLHRALRGPEHALLLFDGERAPSSVDAWTAAAELARAKAGESVRVIRVRRGEQATASSLELPDPDGAIHLAWGARRPLAAWIRPDKHIGFRGAPGAIDSLAAYLDGMFGSAGDRERPPSATAAR